VSMTDLPVSTVARKRIRTFSTWLWVWGAVVLFIGALNTYGDVGIGGGGFGIVGEERNPWDRANPPVFDADGDTYSGDGSGVIRIPLEEHGQQAYAATLLTDEYLDLFVTNAEDVGRPDNDRGYPSNIAYLYNAGAQTFVLPPDADLELWVRADEAWELTLQPAEAVEITDGYAGGSGNELLVYRGDAVSARFVHRGDGLFYVTVQTFGSRSERPIIESGEVDERYAWGITDTVYFSIESDADRGAWAIDIDELATDSPVAPDPEPLGGGDES
jgi:hypothetical protein